MKFSNTASYFHLLENVFIGKALQQTRVAQLDSYEIDPDTAEMLVVGEGNGRFLENLVRMYPGLRVTIVDESAEMLARAKSRLLRAELPVHSLDFRTEDIREVVLAEHRYTHILTNSFFSNFPEAVVSSIAGKLSAAAKEDAEWWHGDFVMPKRGLSRWRAKAWLAMLYAFFGATAAVPVRTLPEVDRYIEKQGFVRGEDHVFCGSLRRSSRYQRVKSA